MEALWEPCSALLAHLDGSWLPNPLWPCTWLCEPLWRHWRVRVRRPWSYTRKHGVEQTFILAPEQARELFADMRVRLELARETWSLSREAGHDRVSAGLAALRAAAAKERGLEQEHEGTSGADSRWMTLNTGATSARTSAPARTIR